MTRPHLHDFRGGESAWCTFPGCRATAHPNGCTCGLDVENPNVIAEADLGCPMHGLQEDFKYQIPLADAVQHAIAVLKVMGLDDNLDNRSHMTALVQAMLLYEERKAERAEVWARSGVKGQVFHVMAKAERAFEQVMRGEVPNPDHFIDLINYATFAVRLGDDLNGSWNWDGTDR